MPQVVPRVGDFVAVGEPVFLLLCGAAETLTSILLVMNYNHPFTIAAKQRCPLGLEVGPSGLMGLLYSYQLTDLTCERDSWN
jgi:hypothetical protein